MAEVRPIDANALREILNNAQIEFDENYKGLGKAKSILDDMPTLNYEPVVRCKDCKYRYMLHDRLMCKRTAKKAEDEKYGINDYWGLIAVTENHFCSYGAKMDEGVK